VACARWLVLRSDHDDQRERKKGEEHLYREEKYAHGLRDQHAALHLLRRLRRRLPQRSDLPHGPHRRGDYLRKPFVFGKDELLEPMEKSKRIDVSKRQTPAVLKFKEQRQFSHNR